MYSAAARVGQLHPGKLRARCKEGDELHERGPTRACRKVALDLWPRAAERQQFSGNAADQLDDVKAVPRLDRRADCAHFQVHKRTLELWRRHPRRDLTEIAARCSRRTVRVRGSHLCERAGVVEQQGARDFGALACCLEGCRLIPPRCKEDVRALEDLRRAETWFVLRIVAT